MGIYWQSKQVQTRQDKGGGVGGPKSCMVKNFKISFFLYKKKIVAFDGYIALKRKVMKLDVFITLPRLFSVKMAVFGIFFNICVGYILD